LNARPVDRNSNAVPVTPQRHQRVIGQIDKTMSVIYKMYARFARVFNA